MLSVGKFLAIPTGAALGETSKGDPQVVVSFDVPEQGETATWYGFFTEKTERRTIETLRYCGWIGDDITDLSSIGGDPSVRVELDVGADTYEGKTRARVNWVNRPGGIALAKPLDAGKKSMLANRIKGLVLDVTKSTGRDGAYRASGDAPTHATRTNGNGARPPIDTSREPDWMRDGPPDDGCPI